MVKVKKCDFIKKELKFLGHIISREGIRTDPEKIEKMVNIGPPKNLKELRSRLAFSPSTANTSKDSQALPNQCMS